MERLLAILSEKTKTKVNTTEFLTIHERIDKPWGYEIIWAKTKDYVGKLLFVRAKESLSLQFHKVKEETLYIESGDCIIETGKDETRLEAFAFSSGGVFHVPPGRLHRIKAVTDCRIFEVSTPHLNDVVRLKDNYGRRS